VDKGWNSKDRLDLTRLKNMSVLVGTTIQEFEGWVKKAADENLWLIIMYHRVADTDHIKIYDKNCSKCATNNYNCKGPGPDDVFYSQFVNQMKVINDYQKSHGLQVKTISEALLEIR
jgi:hypothetical protein